MKEDENMIQLKLKDGSIREIETAASAAEIVKGIGMGLYKAACCVKITGEVKDLRTVIPQRKLKPTVFQLRKDQSFALGGLARIDLYGCDHASAVFYMSDEVKLHRGKVSDADELWKKHYNGMLVPVAKDRQFRKFSIRKEMDKMDIVIDGLGWVCVHGTMRNVDVYVPQNVNVTFRKAML